VQTPVYHSDELIPTDRCSESLAHRLSGRSAASRQLSSPANIFRRKSGEILKENKMEVTRAQADVSERACRGEVERLRGEVCSARKPREGGTVVDE